MDAAALEPQVALPHTVDNVRPVTHSDCKDIKVHQAYLGSSTNGNYDDFAAAAEVLKGRTVAPGTRGRPAKESLSQVGPDGEDGELDLPDLELSPEAALEDAERAMQAANALARLDEEERLVLILWLEHDDMSAVARASGRTLAEARRIKERAVRKARKMIEKGEVGATAEAPELVRLFSSRRG